MNKTVKRITSMIIALTLALGGFTPGRAKSEQAELMSSGIVNLAYFYKPPSNSDAATVASNFNAAILSGNDESFRDQLTTNGFSNTVLQYFGWIGIQDPGGCTATPRKNQVAYNVGDFCSISENHPDWFLLDSNGQRILASPTSDTYRMDPGSQGWREFFVTRVLEYQASKGWSGLFLDNLEASLTEIQKYGHILANYPDDASYQAAIRGFLDYLKANYSRPVLANIIARRDEASWFSYMPYLDGAMQERWVVDWQVSQYLSEAQWKNDLALAEKTQNQGKHIILVAPGNETDANRQNFAFASYLLISNGKAAFRYSNAASYRQVWLYNNYRVDLGTPLGPRFQSGSSWRRDFTKGYVVVDPVNHTATISTGAEPASTPTAMPNSPTPTVESPTSVIPTATPTTLPPTATQIQPTATAVIQPSATPTIATTSAPAAQSSETTYDDQNLIFVYSSGWWKVSDSQAYSGSYNKTTRPRATVAFPFTGQSFSILYKGGNSFSSFDILVDGVSVGTLNQKLSTTSYQQRWDYPGQLAPGKHTLKLVFQSTNSTSNGSLDAVIVRSMAPVAQAAVSSTSPAIPPTNTLLPSTPPSTASPAPLTIQPTDTVPLPTSTTVAPTVTPTALPPTNAPAQPSPTAILQPALSSISTGSGMWISQSELMSLPTSGTAWNKMRSVAYGSWGTADLKNQNNKHAINTLAGALAYARTGDPALRSKVRDGIIAAKRTLDESSEWQTTSGVLAAGRQLGAYVISADLIDLKNFDAAADNEFRSWLTSIRTTNIGTHGRWKAITYTCENATANWSTFACASRIAASIYLGDTADVQRAASIIRAFLGERNAYPANAPGRNGYFQHTAAYSASWACDDPKWTGINPSCVKSGINVDGVLVEDASRGGGCCTLQGDGMMYSWEALQGLFVSAELLYRTGSYGNPYSWSNQALRRAVDFMQRSGWGISNVAKYVPWMANARYGTNYPTAGASTGRIMSWGDWLYRSTTTAPIAQIAPTIQPTNTLPPTAQATASPVPTTIQPTNTAIPSIPAVTASPVPATIVASPTALPPTAIPTQTNPPAATSTAVPTNTSSAITLSFVPVADSYVQSDNPATNYGTATTFRVDGSRIVRSYLRFDVQGLNSTPAKVTLRIYANSAADAGAVASSVGDNTWTESAINYNNAPPVGNALGASGAIGAGTWISIDITAYVTGNGTYNIALTTPGSTAISLASREAGASAPQLIIQTAP